MKKLTAILAGLVFLAFTGFASAEYIDNGDFTITDTDTGLMWQQLYSKGNWDTAYNYCENLEVGDHYDWRLPTMLDLEGLIDPDSFPYIDPVFNCASGAAYWSSNVEGDSAWIIWSNRIKDYFVLHPKTMDNYVRCVRGATLPTNTSIIGSDLSIDIPTAQYNGVLYELKLKYYSDPSLPSGFYWKLDSVQKK